MMPELPDMSGAVSMATTSMAYLIYHFFLNSDRFIRYMDSRFDERQAAIRKVLIQRVLGVLLFGLVPLFMVMVAYRRPLAEFGASTLNLGKSLLWWMPVGLLVMLISYVASRAKGNLALYPQIRVREWTRPLLVLSALSWISYLVAYEFMFRGFLLFTCYSVYGYWPSILINLCLYALVHVPKGAGEAFGSIAVGFVFCLASLYFGSFWFALMVHITMALSNEWFSIRFHPDMKTRKNSAYG